jgi:hypothetical protein
MALDLVKALGDFIAAVLSLVGFVGKPRRRAAIRDDLTLLRELEAHEDFGRGSGPHLWLTNHIMFEIATFSGLDLRTSWRKPQWSAIVFACIVWIPLGWLTYHLVAVGHPWYAWIPAIPAAVFFLVTFPLIFNKEEAIPEEDESAETPTEP